MGLRSNRLRLACALGMGLLSQANVWAVTELPGIRTDLLNQGYLQHKVNPAAGVGRFGEELTGWIDIRHPLLDGATTSVPNPYDFSNHYINEHSILLNDNTGVATQSVPNMLRDWDRSSKIYGQAGLSTPRISSATAQVGVTWANFDGDERLSFSNAGTGRAAAATTLNVYYAKSFGDSTANGVSRPPNQVNGTTILNPYSYLQDSSVDSTQPHEVGHQALNSDSLWQQTPGTPSESDDTKNLMYKSGQNYNFNAIGRDNGRIESTIDAGQTVSQMRQLYNNGGANNPGFVQRRLGLEDYGNKVDWNYVQDDRTLETVAGTADDHAGTLESLYFAPGNSAAIAQPTHVQTGLGTFQNVGDYAGIFRYADVFSIIARYADFDRTAPAGDFDARNGALDYTVFFQDAGGSTFAGTLDTIFQGGWTTNTSADNFLARWVSPVDAVGLFIFSKSIDGTFDGNAQIDAVIVAAAVPEPATAGLVLLASASALLRRSRHRRAGNM